jgi:hypothetical protein
MRVGYPTKRAVVAIVLMRHNQPQPPRNLREKLRLVKTL